MNVEEPTGTCVVCWQVDPDRGYVCERDRQRLARALWQLRDLHALLPHALAPGRGAQQLVRTGRAEAPLPLRADPLDLAGRPPANAGLDAVQDYRGDQVGAIGVAAILDGWARDWSTYRDDEDLPEPTVPALVTWLSMRLDWACTEHPAVDDFARELTVLLYTCRSVLAVSEAPIYSDLACPRCKTAALRRQPGDAVWRCGECREEVEVEREDGAMIVSTYYGEALLVVDGVETQVYADLMVEQEDQPYGRKTWRGTIDNRLRTVTEDLGGSRGVLRLPDGREGKVFVAGLVLRVNHPYEWPVQGDGPAPFGERAEG